MMTSAISSSISSSSSSSLTLLPVFSVILEALDRADLVSASSVCRQWRASSQPSLDRARARLRARDQVLSAMRSLPLLEDWAFYPAAARLHVFRSPGTELPTAWLLLFEVLGWRDLDSNGGRADYLGERYTLPDWSPNAQPPPDALHDHGAFMMALDHPPQRQDCPARLTVHDRGPLDEGEEAEPLEEVDPEVCQWGFNLQGLHPSVRYVQMRNGCCPISQDSAWYAERGVGPNAESDMEHPAGWGEHGICGPGLLRALVVEHRDELFGTQQQLQRLLNPAVQLHPLLRLDDWYHMDHTRPSQQWDGGDDGTRADDEPRDNPTFRAIAQCIADGSAVHYHRQVEAGRLPPPNTHWKYWKDAGFR